LSLLYWHGLMACRFQYIGDRMSNSYKKEIDTCQNALEKMESSFDTFIFSTIEEKDIFMKLLREHIEHLKRVNNYCDHWHGNTDWEDPRR